MAPSMLGATAWEVPAFNELPHALAGGSYCGLAIFPVEVLMQIACNNMSMA